MAGGRRTGRIRQRDGAAPGTFESGPLSLRDAALFTDLYEIAMSASYFRERMNGPATFSLFVRTLPRVRGFLVAAGLADVLAYLETFRFTEAALGYLRTLGRFEEPFLDFLGSVRFLRSDQRAYVADPAPFGTVASAKQAARAQAMVGEDARQNRSVNLRSHKHRVPGRGWIVEEARPEVFAGGMAGERVIAVSEGRRILSWVWYVGVESTWREAMRELLALDHSPFRRARHAYVIRLSTDLDGRGEADVDRAERRLRLLARSLRARLPREPRT